MRKPALHLQLQGRFFFVLLRPGRLMSGSPRGISILELTRQVATELSPESEINLRTTPQTSVAPSLYIPSTEWTQKEFGSVKLSAG